MASPSSPLLHGTLEVLVLKALSSGIRHGYGIARWIEDTTREVVQVEEGSLYPALYRMEKRGLIESEWGTSELNHRAKFYCVTRKGARHLALATAEWKNFSDAVSRVLAPEPRKRYV